MPTAREIITGALTLHINRLSPGEQIDADLAATSLSGLNYLVDQINGQKSFLFREILTQSTPLTGTFGTLGTDWPGLKYGDEILSATVRYTSGVDIPIARMDMELYAAIPIKTVPNIPQQYAHDGADKVYLYPAATGQQITLRTRQAVQDFADLDANYEMPKGYRSALSAMLAEILAPNISSTGITPAIAMAAKAARSRIGAQAVTPAILNAPIGAGRLGSFLAGR